MNMRLKRLNFVLFAVATLVMLALPATAQSVTEFWGNVTIGSSAANGAVVEAFIGSASTPAAKSTVGDNFLSGYYGSVVECTSGGANIFLKVWGINASNQSCIVYAKTLAN